MKKNQLIISSLIIVIATVTIMTACNKDAAPAAAAPDYSWIEEFDTLQTAFNNGWAVVNNSRPLGPASWMQGQFGADKKGLLGFAAASHSYSGTDFVLASYNATGDVGTISAWLISPSTTMKNGDEIKFYTRTFANPASYPDRMEVRLNPTSDSSDTGSTPLTNIAAATNVGNFKTLLLSVNPNLTTAGYPGDWQQYTITLSGLPAPVKRRFAFRYFVTNAGTTGVNGQGIGLDAVQFISK